jgi:hypothetical protein
MQTTTRTETPGTGDRPDELPENERPEEFPQISPRPDPSNPRQVSCGHERAPAHGRRGSRVR